MRIFSGERVASASIASSSTGGTASWMASWAVRVASRCSTSRSNMEPVEADLDMISDCRLEKDERERERK